MNYDTGKLICPSCHAVDTDFKGTIRTKEHWVCKVCGKSFFAIPTKKMKERRKELFREKKLHPTLDVHDFQGLKNKE